LMYMIMLHPRSNRNKRNQKKMKIKNAKNLQITSSITNYW
jgi:hypothetical protein